MKYLDTRVLTKGMVPAEDTGSGLRAVINGFALAVDGNRATVTVPAGGQVTIVNALARQPGRWSRC